jgi:hypothetical protein
MVVLEDFLLSLVLTILIVLQGIIKRDRRFELTGHVLHFYYASLVLFHMLHYNLGITIAA